MVVYNAMRMIKVFDEKNYDEHWGKYKRDSARAIIFCDKKLAMIKSEKYGEYKFPGGGIDNNETHIETIIRETKEETGLHILPESIREYGKTLIIRRDNLNNINEIFEQESFYYLCDVDTECCSLPNLNNGYETEYNYQLVYVSLDNAIDTNKNLVNIKEIPWVQRDLTVLYELRDSLY